MDSTLRETLRQRHEARLAAQRAEERRREEAIRQAEEEEERRIEEERRREADALAERLVPLVQLQVELQDLTATVADAQRPGQVIPLLRQLAAVIQTTYNPEIEGGQELLNELQAAVVQLVMAFNDNERLVLQVGSYEHRTIQELIQTITTTMGVDIEIAAPLMDTSRDEELARQLAGPLAGPAAAAGSPVRVPVVFTELEEYRRVLSQLRSIRYAKMTQVQSILRQLPPPPGDLTRSRREQLADVLEELLTYVERRWSNEYDLQQELQMLREFQEQLNA